LKKRILKHFVNTSPIYFITIENQVITIGHASTSSGYHVLSFGQP
jgi:hypothetical protein